MVFKSDDDKMVYWKENFFIFVKLLVVWFVVFFGCGIFLVDVLNEI